MPSPKTILSGMAAISGSVSPSAVKAKAFSEKIGLAPPCSSGIDATVLTTKSA